MTVKIQCYVQDCFPGFAMRDIEGLKDEPFWH